MATLDPKERVLGITRSQTVDSYPNPTNGVLASTPNAQKLNRVASNANIVGKDKMLDRVPDLRRSVSLDLRHEMEHLSLDPSGAAGGGEQSQKSSFTQTTPAAFIQQPIMQQTVGVAPDSPWTSPVTPLYTGSIPPTYHLTQQPQQVLITPVQSPYMPPSPIHFPLIPPTPGTQAYAGLGIGSLSGMSMNFPPSPGPMYGMNLGVQPMDQMQYFQGSSAVPYTLSPMMTGYSPMATQMGSGLNDLELPQASMANLQTGSSPRVLSKAQNQSYGGFGFQGSGGMSSQTNPNLQHNSSQQQHLNSFVNRAASMLETLRYRMRTASGIGLGRGAGSGSAMYQNVGIHWGLQDIKGLAIDFSKDQFGSRFIQSKLEDPSVSQDEKNEVFAELQPFIAVLCKDVFGNYVIQKLLEVGVGTKEQHNVIFKSAINGNMVDLSRHMYGCRVVQKLVEQIFRDRGNHPPAEESESVVDVYRIHTQNSLLAEVGSEAVNLVFDQNGNHVIQKCIQVVKPISRISFLFDAFREQYVMMSAHSYGCRVVQRVLETGALAVILDVVVEIMGDLATLVTDQYANYVIQHIVEHQRQYSTFSHGESAIGSLKVGESEVLEKLKAYRRTLYSTIAIHILRFSQDKCGSNVVEKCVNFGSKEEKKQLVIRVMEPDILFMMMQDPYANYVVQKVIEAASPQQLDHIVAVVRKHEDRLKGLSYGKHILNKLNMGTSQKVSSFPVYN